jgi:quercetin dioxygenase-like cupin family protein
MNRFPLATLLVLLAGASFAQQAGITRHELVQQDLDTPGLVVAQVRVGFAPGALAARHKHPGVEVAYVLDGTLQYQLDGKVPLTLQAGQTLLIPAGTVHSARNIGDGQAEELATYIVKKGMPLVLPP